LFVENDEAAVDEEMHRKLDEISERLAALEARLAQSGAADNAVKEPERTPV
jgi:hypothetical protein